MKLLDLFAGSLIFLAFSSLAWGSEKECSHFHEGLPAVHFSRQFFEPTTCYLDVTPIDTDGLIYRSYLLSDQGLFMVFNSYGDGPPSSTTGARVFYLLPRNQNPDREIKDGNLIIKTATSGTEIVINGLTAKLEGIYSSYGLGKIIEDSTIAKDNYGGIEISSYPGLVIDLGFAMGKDPASNPKNPAILTGKNGKTCKLKASDIFSYTASGDYHFTRDDQDFKKYLTIACPGLDPGY